MPSSPANVEVASTESPELGELKRDRLTWVLYLLFGGWSFAWGMFGPVMPFLRNQLSFNYSIAALHFSALAVGVVAAGFCGHKVIQRLGVSRAIAVGVALIMAGTFLALVGNHYYLTICGALFVGSGAYMGQAILTAATERFGMKGPQAIAELGISSAILGAVAPLTVAATVGSGLNWKLALVSPLLLYAVLIFAARGSGVGSLRLPELNREAAPGLPKVYWLYFSIVFLSVSGEWSIGFWCPEFLTQVIQTSPIDGCNGLSVFLFAMLAGRIMGSRLIAAGKARWLLPASTILGACGFVLFWLGGSFIVCLAGLVVVGLGLANVYPLALAAAMAASDGKTTEAATRMSLSTGSAILLAPLLLGGLADSIGLFWSHAIVAFLLVLAAIVTTLTVRPR